METRTRYILLAIVLIGIVGAIFVLSNLGVESTCPPAPPDLSAEQADLTCAPGFQGATGWLNTADGGAVDLEDLRGNVVFVDFWTYSCINCIHTLPHVTSLYDAYAEFGLVVVGVHSPEFGFERDPGNVADAIERHGVHYPVAQDNDFSIWNAYNNRYWPAHYILDAQGRIRFTHIGEGDYAEAEEQVRELLVESGHALPAPIEPDTEDRFGPRATPELYAATRRSAIANPEGYSPGTVQTYAQVDVVQPDRIYLAGTWNLGSQSLEADQNASVRVRYSAAAANAVLDGYSCLPLRIDGLPISQAMAGPDVSFASGEVPCVQLDGARSYDLLQGEFASHELTLDMPAGTRLYTFDFTSA